MLVQTVEDDPALISQIERALALIKEYDPRRYRRLRRDLDRIWVRLLPGPLGQFNPPLKACELDVRFVREQPIEFLAAVIVHEAVHARIWSGFDHYMARRDRIERLCTQEEFRFASKLPNSDGVREWTEASLRQPPDVADVVSVNRGYIEGFQYMGVPSWFIRIIFFFKRLFFERREAQK